MQIGKTLVIAACAMLIFGGTYAQQIGGIQRGQRGYVPPPVAREQGAMAIDDTLKDIDEKMDFYATEFELDAFEKAVVKNYIVEYETEKMTLLANENIEYEVKQQSVLKLNDKLSANLATMLSEDQLARFGELHFTKQKKRKNKKKRNNKN